ncbi:MULTISPECIES: peptidylprolyl isomerase [unclassified Novosphingobium]|uniref:peptidylprolyl isomerase n=1 Tax=unclassified Novosphingobium TaxID=2644732 RepID=UPI000EE951D0|nr:MULTISPECIES: peptidylprolyl isomerase [unclassified Novosphingobium]HCF24853.1 peptidylprolyl isomerase [Novosphingobium sp.]HQV04360.1 peptidylprolyl isomerase [Novosphingobium sp.]
MRILLPTAALLALAASPVYPQASANLAAGKTQPSPLAPSEIVAQAPKADWTAIAASDLLVMDLAPDAKGKPRRVVIQLMPPPFSQGWIGNIRKLTVARFWDGTAVNRVQDNYVVQWGDPDAEDKVKAKKLPEGLAVMPESEYETSLEDPYKAKPKPVFAGERGRGFDAYSRTNYLYRGWPVAMDYIQYVPIKDATTGRPIPAPTTRAAWPVHCYGMVGVGRDLSPNTGNGAELYVVIGHAPRHLDRNIALVGRVIEGIEHLSSLPRGHGALGFYDLAQGDERTGIRSIRLGTEVKDLPAYEYLSTESQSFAQYADARANRRDAFFIRPAGGADICNIPVPVRRVK